MEQVFAYAKEFGIQPVKAERFGGGHINLTYLVTDQNGDEYILQCVNTNVFRDVDKLMSNIMKVTDFAIQYMESHGIDSSRRVLRYVRAGERAYIPVEGGAWRCYHFIGKAKAYQIVEDPRHFYEAGRAFGKFQRMLAKFPAGELYETIPDFHNTVKRVENLKKAIDTASEERLQAAKEEIEFALSRTQYASVVVDKLASGEIPLKVTHNDTKFNNVLIDDETGEGICVIDLDTMMSGSSLYDFGDAIRFGCNPAAEDEKDLSKVHFSMPLFRQFATGYVEALGKALKPNERRILAFSAILMTYECGTRFLTDFLEGDVYFRTNREGQNLDRCRTQFKLVTDMEKVIDEMQAFIDKL